MSKIEELLKRCHNINEAYYDVGTEILKVCYIK